MTTQNPLNIEAALAALAQSLEAMAFVSLAPIDGPPPPLGDGSVLVRLAFTGPVCGTLSILAPRALGRLLVGNVTASADGPACADAQADDAIGEVANVVCGRLLRTVDGGKFMMGLPWGTTFFADEGWAALAAGSGESIIVDAEGIPIGLRLSLDDRPLERSEPCC